MLAVRGIVDSHETVRQWGLKFGREIANAARSRAPRRGDKWHLDEVVITIAGRKHWLWRAVDQAGYVLDVLVQSRRDKKAAKRLLRKLLKKQGRAPRVMITDKLRSYGAAKKDLKLVFEHRQHKGLNNRAENSHQPTRCRSSRSGAWLPLAKSRRASCCDSQPDQYENKKRNNGFRCPPCWNGGPPMTIRGGGNPSNCMAVMPP